MTTSWDHGIYWIFIITVNVRRIIFTTKIQIIVILLILSTVSLRQYSQSITYLETKNIPACPKSHPFAYNNGKNCCRTNTKKTHLPKGSLCDGSRLDITSICCKNDDHVQCTASTGSCGNYGKRNVVLLIQTLI